MVHEDFYLLFKAVSLIGLDCCHGSRATWPASFYGPSCSLLPASYPHGYRCAWFSTHMSFSYGAWLYFKRVNGRRVGEASLGGDEHVEGRHILRGVHQHSCLANRPHSVTLGLFLPPLPRSGCSGLNDSVRLVGDTGVYLIGSHGTMTILQHFFLEYGQMSCDYNIPYITPPSQYSGLLFSHLSCHYT